MRRVQNAEQKLCFAVAYAILCICTQLATARTPKQPTTSLERQQKVFSIFSVVSFPNNICRSSVSSAGVTRNGTCYTTGECTDRGGSQSGNCALGFGTCCVFTIRESGTVSENSTYLQSPNFPNPLTDTGQTFTYTVNKVDPDVCHLRLDFDRFEILAPAGSNELNTACQDSLTITSTSYPGNYPVLCGNLGGEHVYVTLGRDSSDTVTLGLTFGAAAGDRRWDIRTSQILCGDLVAPPEGCFQYHLGATGTLKSFNFDVTGETHLGSQNYAICIRREEGHCCNRYSVCSIVNSFTLFAGDAAITTARLDTGCTQDYIRIAGGASTCTFGDFELRDRFCGRFLNTRISSATAGNPAFATNTPVCDCTPPFTVDIVTDNAADLAAGNDDESRGVCLNYAQVPCN